MIWPPPRSTPTVTLVPYTTLFRSAGSETGEIYLVKDEKAVFVEGKNQLRKQTYSPEIQPELNIWRKNTVSFNNAPVKEVVKVLNEEFNIELKVAETDLELNNYILKADFTDRKRVG